MTAYKLALASDLSTHTLLTQSVHGIADTAKLATLNTVQAFTGQKTYLVGGAGGALKLDDSAPTNGSHMMIFYRHNDTGSALPPGWDVGSIINSQGAFLTNAYVVISGTLAGSPDSDGVRQPQQATADGTMLSIRSDVDGPAVQIRPLGTANARALDVIQDSDASYRLSLESSGMVKWGAGNRAAQDTNLYRVAAGTLKTDGGFQVAGRLDALGNISTQTLVDGNIVVRIDLTTGSGQTQFKNFGVVWPRVTVAYSASMTPDLSLGNTHVITATNATPFTVNNPANPITGQPYTYTVRNTSGGALGAGTFGAGYKMATWTQPLNGFSRSITFVYDGTNSIEVGRTPADVPN